jgi:hypothetical protein
MRLAFESRFHESLVATALLALPQLGLGLESLHWVLNSLLARIVIPEPERERAKSLRFNRQPSTWNAKPATSQLPTGF